MTAPDDVSIVAGPDGRRVALGGRPLGPALPDHATAALVATWLSAALGDLRAAGDGDFRSAFAGAIESAWHAARRKGGGS